MKIIDKFKGGKKYIAAIVCVAMVFALSACNTNPNDPAKIILSAYKNTATNIEKESADILNKSKTVKALMELMQGKYNALLEYKLAKDAAKDIVGMPLKSDTTLYFDYSQDGKDTNEGSIVKFGAKNETNDLWASIFVNKNNEFGVQTSLIDGKYGFNINTLVEDFEKSPLNVPLSTAGLNIDTIKSLSSSLMGNTKNITNITKDIETQIANMKFNYLKDETITIGMDNKQINTQVYTSTISGELFNNLAKSIEAGFVSEYPDIKIKNIGISFYIANDRIYGISADFETNKTELQNYKTMIKLGTETTYADYFDILVTVGAQSLKMVIASNNAEQNLSWVVKVAPQNNTKELTASFRVTPDGDNKEKISISAGTDGKNLTLDADATVGTDTVDIAVTNITIPNGDTTTSLKDVFKFVVKKLDTLDIPTSDITNIFKMSIDEVTAVGEKLFSNIQLQLFNFVSLF